MLSQISGTVSNEGLNIENMTNKSKGDMAYTILDIAADDISKESLQNIQAIDGIIRVRVIK